MAEETLEEFAESFSKLRIPHPGPAVRTASGELRSLTADEWKQLGVDTVRQRERTDRILQPLMGKDIPIGGSRFCIRLSPK